MAADSLPTNRQVFAYTSFREPALSAASQAGMVSNLNDGLAWGLFPILFATTGMAVEAIGILASLILGVWGFGQLITGQLSDRWGRKHLITAGGMLTQAGGSPWWRSPPPSRCGRLAAVLIGAGTAMVKASRRGRRPRLAEGRGL